jgi:amidase
VREQTKTRIGDPGDTLLVGSIPAKLPVGIDFLAMPFGKPMLFRIASEYERATRHRMSPPEFGPLEEKK